jgi:membrane-associated protein
MEFFHKLYDLLRHLNDEQKWQAVIAFIGLGRLYVVLFAIIFAETGLVVTPFLPGDSLLFAIGAISAHENSPLSLPTLALLLIAAAVAGDAVNYWIGHRLGPAVFNRENSRLLNKKHLLRAQEFYEKYGGKTIILARFVPVVRTFAPFVAGIGRMNYFRFFLYNVVGAIAWVLLCLTAGHLLGGFSFIKQHFEIVILIIIAISLLPMVIEYLLARRRAKAKALAAVESGQAML